MMVAAVEVQAGTARQAEPHVGDVAALLAGGAFAQFDVPVGQDEENLRVLRHEARLGIRDIGGDKQDERDGEQRVARRNHRIEKKAAKQGNQPDGEQD